MQAQCRIHSACIQGVRALPVDVEVMIGSGLPGFMIVGMPDAAIQEARERVKSAIKSSGFAMPSEKIVVNLAPGSLKKSGSGFDLPIAVGILLATGQLNPCFFENKLLVGELSLDGSLRPVSGVLACEICAQEQGLDLVCAHGAPDLYQLDDLKIYCVSRMSSFTEELLPTSIRPRSMNLASLPDFAQVSGHAQAKRAFQIAACGNHGLLMTGSPGSGKSLLASCMPSLLPELSDKQALDSALIYSVAGLDPGSIIAGQAPFRSPHHSATTAGLIGGGTPPVPGEVSLAHQGVLFLDELAEFKPSTLQALRQPLESGIVSLVRAGVKLDFPARFMLLAASNPCPCGYFGDRELACSCSDAQVRSYQNRIGGPLLDRIDIHIRVERPAFKDLISKTKPLSSQELKEGVMIGRSFSSWRVSQKECTNKPLNMQELISFHALQDDAIVYLKEFASKSHLSARSIKKSILISRTIADMDESREVSFEHLCEALSLRVRDM